MRKEETPVNWVIEFTNKKVDQIKGCKPSFNFFIPNEDSGIRIPRKKQMQALKFLKEIQENCNTVKKDCKDTLDRKSDKPYHDQILNITDDIKSLFDIITQFSKLMRNFEEEEGDSFEKKP